MTGTTSPDRDLSNSSTNDAFYVLPTIDTEGVHGDRPFDALARGDIGLDQDWGALRIARILNDHGVRGTFFVDVYEHALFGERPVAELCVQLAELGQDIQLHTHPAWRDDPRDGDALRTLKMTHGYRPQSLDLLTKLSREQQAEMLIAGVLLIKKWTGRDVVIHRSGAYAINDDTIFALRESGIRYDSSMHRQSPNSLITWSQNQIVCSNGVTEVPVTGMRITAGVGGLTAYDRVIKTDLNFLEPKHLQRFCEDGRGNGLRFMNFFMHSYSLINYSANFSKLSPAVEIEDRFRSFLQWSTTTPGIRVLACDEFVELLDDVTFDRGSGDFVPEMRDNALVASRVARRVGVKMKLFAS